MAENDFKNIKEVFEKAKRGDRESFSEIYEAYFKPVYRYVYLRIGNRAESDDLAQDIFINTLNSIDSASYDSSPLIYFYNVARKSISDWKRKRRRVMPSDENMGDYFNPGPGDANENLKGEEFDNLRETIKELSDDEQDAVIFKFVGNLSSEDTGSLLGISAHSARRLEARGLISIRDILKKQYEQQS